MAEDKSGTEKLRDAIAAKHAAEWGLSARPSDYAMADAILALPEMVALAKIEQAARAWAAEYEPATSARVNPEYYTAAEIALVAAVDEFEAAS